LGDVGLTTVESKTVSTATGAILPIGENIYGPFEAGFTSQQDTNLESLGCSSGTLGHVSGGIDTHMAEQMVAHQCGITLPRTESGEYISLLDECGGHTRDYHFHERLSCLYTETLGHSTKVGEALDGKGLYGKWEDYATRTLPLLDACGGHFGVTPDSNGVSVYHYHVQLKAPFTIGCFGPMADANGDQTLVTLEKCRSLYSGCGDGDAIDLTSTEGTVLYDLWCPCFDGEGSNTGNAELMAFSADGNTNTLAGQKLPDVPASLGGGTTSGNNVDMTPVSGGAGGGIDSGNSVGPVSGGAGGGIDSGNSVGETTRPAMGTPPPTPGGAQVADAMHTCVQKNIGALGLVGDARPTEEQIKSIHDECDTTAMNDFVTGGGSATDFELVKLEGARGQVADTMTTCIASIAVDQNAPTDAERATCDEQARTAFENAGGNTATFDQEKVEALTGALSNSMEACIKANAAVATAPTHAEIMSCESTAQEAFVHAGGSADEFARAKDEGAANAAGSAMESCIKPKIDALGLAGDARPTEAQMSTFQGECDDTAMNDFVASGGDSSSFERAKLEGARGKVADTMTTCIDSSAVDKSAPTKDEFNACEDQAKEAFENAGGNSADFDREKVEAATGALSNSMEACIKANAAVATAPTHAEIMSCESTAQEAFVHAGGSADEFARAKDEGAANVAGSAMESCMKDKISALGLAGDARPTDAQMQSFLDGCDDSVFNDFVASGGDTSGFERAILEGARGKVADTMTTCIDSSAVDKSAPTKAEIDACDTQALVAFENAGGNAANFDREMVRAAEGALTDSMGACIKANAAVATAPTHAEIMSCESTAQEAFVHAGGSADEFARAKDEGAANAAGSAMESCTKVLITALGLAADTRPTMDQMDVMHSECDNTARSDFVASGGNVDQFERAVLEGARGKVADTMTTCIESTAVDKTAPTDGEIDACETTAKVAFENAGGNGNDFERQKMNAEMEVIGDSMGACIRSKAAVVTAPTEAEIASCGGTAEQAFVQAGGTAEEFSRAKNEGAAKTAGSSMDSCAMLKVEALDLAGDARPTETQMRGFIDECSSTAKADFVASGGNAADFELAIVEGSANAISETLETCIKAGAADPTAPTTVELGACNVKARNAFETSGGDPDDFERRMAGAAIDSLGGAIEACVKSAVNPDAPTAEEFNACSQQGMDTYALAGGDMQKFELAKREGAQATATEVRQACTGDATACKASAKKAFEQAGGSAVDFERVAEAGARDAMMEKMEVCVETKVSALDLSGADPTSDQSKTALIACEIESQEYFLLAGGDPAEFKEQMAEGARDGASDVMVACMSASAAATPTPEEKAACEDKAKELAANLGDPPQRFERTMQEGARKALSSTLETCMKAATTDTARTTCTDVARETFESAGGDATKFEEEQRQGAGEVAGDQLKSCLKTAVDVQSVDDCDATAKEAHVNAGGNTEDYWYDAKNGMLSDTVTFNSICIAEAGKTSTECTAEAKDYFTDVLKGSASDWNEDDFAKAVTYADTPTAFQPSSSVDARFTFSQTDIDVATLESKKSALQTAVVDAATGATSATCGDAATVGSKTAVVCRIETGTVGEATSVETAARSGAYSAAVGTAVGTARRLGHVTTKKIILRRTLAAVAVQSVDSSTVLTEYNTTAVVTDAVRVVGLATIDSPTPDDTTTGTTLTSEEEDTAFPLGPVIGAVAVVVVLLVVFLVCKIKGGSKGDAGEKSSTNGQVIQSKQLDGSLEVRPATNVNV
jgi:hypothetical protein